MSICWPLYVPMFSKYMISAPLPVAEAAEVVLQDRCGLEVERHVLDLRVAVVLVAVCSNGRPVRPSMSTSSRSTAFGGHGGAGGGDGGGGTLGGSSCPGSLGGGGDGNGGDGGGGDGSGGRGDGGGGDSGAAASAAAGSATALARRWLGQRRRRRRRRWRRRRRDRRWRRRRGRRWRRRRCRRRRRRVGGRGVTWRVLRQCAAVVSITAVLAARVQPAEHLVGPTFDVRVLARRLVAGVDGAPHLGLLTRGAQTAARRRRAPTRERGGAAWFACALVIDRA